MERIDTNAMLCDVVDDGTNWLNPLNDELRQNEIQRSITNVLLPILENPTIVPVGLTRLYTVVYKGMEREFCLNLQYVLARMFDAYFYQEGMKYLEEGDSIGCAWSMLRTVSPYHSVRKRLSGVNIEDSVKKLEWYIYGRLGLKMGTRGPFDLSIYKMSLFYLSTKAFVSEAVKTWLLVGKKLGVTRDIRIMIGNAIWRTVLQDTDGWCRENPRKLKKIKTF